jgi:hypothetical protein
MTLAPPAPLWRVGYVADPLAYTPRPLCSFNHRFDDAARRFRTLYLAELPETALREVLADFRPNLAAQRRYLKQFGQDAAEDFAAEPVTAAWRTQHLLASALIDFTGELVDLTDTATRNSLETEHADLLADYDLPHLDLHEITTSRRALTQTIAGHLYDQGHAAVRFPSRLDGNACIALFEDRGQITPAADPIELTDPAPEPLINVCSAWQLKMEPTTITTA